MLADASDSGHREVTEGSKELSLHINCLDSTIRHDEVVLSKPHNSLVRGQSCVFVLFCVKWVQLLSLDPATK